MKKILIGIGVSVIALGVLSSSAHAQATSTTLNSIQTQLDQIKVKLNSIQTDVNTLLADHEMMFGRGTRIDGRFFDNRALGGNVFWGGRQTAVVDGRVINDGRVLGDTFINDVSRVRNRFNRGFRSSLDVFKDSTDLSAEVVLNNGVITGISGNILTITTFNVAKSVRVLTDTEILDRNNNRILFSELQVGDAINVVGIQNIDTPTLLDAQTIRDISLGS